MRPTSATLSAGLDRVSPVARCLTPSLRTTATLRIKSTTSRLGRRTTSASSSLTARRCLRAKVRRPQPKPQPSCRSWAKSSTRSPLGFWTSRRLAVTGSRCLRTPWALKRRPPSTRSWTWLRPLLDRSSLWSPVSDQPLLGLWVALALLLRVLALAHLLTVDYRTKTRRRPLRRLRWPPLAPTLVPSSVRSLRVEPTWQVGLPSPYKSTWTTCNLPYLMGLPVGKKVF